MAIYRGSESTGTATQVFNIDGDKGDIVVTNGGDTWTIDTNVVQRYDANLDQFVNTFTLPTVDGSSGQVLGTNGAGGLSFISTVGTGTVFSVGVATANGLAGTVANPTSSPVITLSTTITGLLKGDGTSISAASAGTDYLNPSAIGTTVQGYSANLAEYSAVNPTVAGLALLDDVDATAQRATLGLVIGTDVQAYNANLTTYATTTPTAAGLALLDDVDASAQRTTLGLGTIATQAANNVSITGGSIAGITDLAVLDGGTGASTGAQAKINLAVISGATGSEIIPAGTTAQRDVTPSTGYFRFNTTTTKFEGYNGTAWGSVGGGATGGGTDEVFVENSQTITTNYTISSGRSASPVGNITVNTGVTVTIPTGSRWVIL